MKSGDPDHGQAMQRMKVGMTGLAAVVLLIVLAGAIFNMASKERAVTAAGSPKPEVVANLTVSPDNVADTTSGSLAELGVAPSATIDNSTSGQAPAATPARRP